MKIKRSTIILGILAMLVFILVGIIISIYPNWLWFEKLNFAPVFWTMVLGKYGVAAVIWFLIFPSRRYSLAVSADLYLISYHAFSE